MTGIHCGAIRATVSALALAMALSWAPGAMASPDGKMAFDMPSENTALALNDLAKAARLQLLFPYDAAARFTARALRGEFTRDEALSRLLANTNLEVASEAGDTITLRERASRASDASGAGDVVTVTGSRIRDVSPTSPVHVVTRVDIGRSGYGQVSDLVRGLPENFAGGENPGVISGSQVNQENADLGGASTVNLRGLGVGATLTLLNGHRLSANSAFQGADISGIPLAALERVEVVPDGASALYGSDAVAGVVNFILRRDYHGTEMTARLGGSAQGGGAQRTLNVLSGIGGPDWHLLGDIQYNRQAPLGWGDRDWITTKTPANTLLNATTYRSLYLGGARDLWEGAQLSFDILAADRASKRTSQASPTAPQYFSLYYTPGVTATLGLDFDTVAGWRGHVVGDVSNSLNKSRSVAPATNYSAGAKTHNQVQYVEGSTDGTLVALPWGRVKAAIGAGYRTEAYRDGYGISKSRNITYAFAETFIPLVAPSDTRTGLHRLELDMSARTEHYSDFGDSTNPKIGLRYLPFGDLALRATWGKSFKAPSFPQMYTTPELDLFDATDVGGTGPGTVIMTYGGNTKLKPETSTNKTLGADYTPGFAPGFRVSATAYDIDYTGRVVQPVSNYLQGLSIPAYAPFVIRNPGLADVNRLLATTPNIYDWTSGPFDPSTVVAIMKDDYENATSQRVSGIDLSVNDAMTVGATRIEVFAAASRMKLRQKTTSASPAVELTGTIFNAPRFKARGGLTVSNGGWAATAIANFVDGEWDTATAPYTQVDSWTTVDMNLTYTFRAGSGVAHGLKLALSASNLFDKAPPRTVTPKSGPFPHFDSANASAMGRFVSLAMIKAF